jgi:hypothetical protein
MALNRSAASLVLFGAATLASGLYRYLSAPDGEKGLWFGLVMGSMGLGAALALGRGRRVVGGVLGVLSVVLVGGWFSYEALVLKGLAVAETRQLALIVMAFVVGVIVARDLRAARASRPPGS